MADRSEELGSSWRVVSTGPNRGRKELMGKNTIPSSCKTLHPKNLKPAFQTPEKHGAEYPHYSRVSFHIHAACQSGFPHPCPRAPHSQPLVQVDEGPQPPRPWESSLPGGRRWCWIRTLVWACTVR